MAAITELLDKLSDGTHTVVDISGNNDECFRFNALLFKQETPCFELLFPPDSWEALDLKIGGRCTLTVEHNGHTFNLVAQLDAVVNERRLRFTAREPVAPSEMRDFFRVSINLPIDASYVAGPREIKVSSWKLKGSTIDLSGSGVLGLFDEKPPSNYRIQLAITLPGEELPIVCLANVIRTYRVRKHRYQVAFHFEHISPKSRDMVISCCLQEQRRQLREHAQTL